MAQINNKVMSSNKETRLVILIEMEEVCLDG